MCAYFSNLPEHRYRFFRSEEELLEMPDDIQT